MAHEIEQLARFVAQTELEAIPDTVRHYARLIVLDTIGVMLAGAARPELGALRASLLSEAGRGATVLAPAWPEADPRTAAMLNGIAGRSIELGEGNRYVMYQGAMQILPGLLSVSEAQRRPGRDVLAGLILGYDAGARLATSMKTRPLAHGNGQGALLGAAAAGARLRRFTAADTSLAMRIASTLMLTPSYHDAVAGATALNVAGGMSCAVVAFAPELAQAGFVAREDAIEEALSSLVGEGFHAERVVEEIGVRWEITRNWLRLRACCNPIYSALDALEEAMAALGAGPRDVERVEVSTFKFASVMSNPEPANFFASKYSLPHVAACLMARGATGHDEVDDSALADPDIAQLRRRVHMREDPAMTALTPALKPARVVLTLKDGRQRVSRCELPRGDNLKPYSETEIREKFRKLAGAALTPEGLRETERAVDRIEDWTSARELTTLLRRHGRSGCET